MKARLLSFVVVAASLCLTSYCSARSDVSTSRVITFSSVNHDFGQVAEGQPLQYGVKVTNNSTVAYPFALSMTGSSDYKYADNCGSSLAAGKSCEIVFTYTPSATGTETTRWTLLSSTASAFTYSPSDGGTLSGTGVQFPGFTVSTSQHNFGTEGVGVTSGAYGVVVYNSTNDNITLNVNTSPANSAEFPLSANNCGATLAANSSCNLQWTFKPGAAQTYSATYSISGTDAKTGQSVILTSGGSQVMGVTLIGTGINANGVTLSAASYNFGDQGLNTTSAPFTAELINGTANTIALQTSGSNASFPMLGSNCGASLAPYASCQVRFDFTPKSAGQLQQAYPISASANGSPVAITSGGQTVTGLTLSGFGVTGTLELKTAGHDFEAWVVNTTSNKYLTTLTNSTNIPVNLNYAYSGNSDNADFTQTADTCSATLLPNAVCSLEWAFSPQSAGALSTTYGITAKDPNNGNSIAVTMAGTTVNGVLLSGNGQASAGVSLATAAHNFGEQGVGAQSATYGTVLYNTSGAPVDLNFGYSDATASKNFTVVANDCGQQLANNAQCNLQWKFTPTTSGAISVVYNVAVTQNGTTVPVTTDSTQVNGITLEGTGVE